MPRSDSEEENARVVEKILPFVKSVESKHIVVICDEITAMNSKRYNDTEDKHREISAELAKNRLNDNERLFKASYARKDRSQLLRVRNLLNTLIKDVDFLLLSSSFANPSIRLDSILMTAIRQNEERRFAPFLEQANGDTQEEEGYDVGIE